MKSTIEIEWILNDLPWNEFCEKHLDTYNQKAMIFVDSEGFSHVVGECGNMAIDEAWYDASEWHDTKVIKYAYLNFENKLKVFI